MADPDAVHTREDLVAYIHQLRAEHREHHHHGMSLDAYFGALAAWIEASPNAWANLGRPNPAQPDWAWVATALHAGTIYD